MGAAVRTCRISLAAIPRRRPEALTNCVLAVFHPADQPTSIHHWQLRDLVACDDAGSIYCVHDSATVRYDIATGKVRSMGTPCLPGPGAQSPCATEGR